MGSNFEFLSRYWPEIAEIGMTAEACLYTSPQMCITKLWSLAQRIVGLMIDYENISVPAELNTEERIKVLRREGRLPEKIDDILLEKGKDKVYYKGFSGFIKKLFKK